MPIDALPTPPSRSDPANFATRGDAFLAALPTFAAQANATAAAMNLNSTTDTSASSVLIGTGAKTFAVAAGKSFQPGMWLVIASTAAPSTNAMYGTITSYSGTTLVMNIVSLIGSGTLATWTISQSAPGGAASGANIDIASLGNNTSTIYTTAGTATALTITPAPAYTAYAIGMSVMVNFSVAPAAGATIAWNGIATPPNLVRQNISGTYSNIAAGDIPINHRSRVTLISTTQALVERLRINQARSNVIGSRAASTTYTNSTPEPIMVYVSGSSPSAGDQLVATVGGNPIYGSVAPTAGNLSCVAFRVLPGENYLVAGNIAGITLFTWSEER